MCETRDLGIKWSHWHSLIFECNVRIDVRYVCPKDVKNVLVQQARSVYWKKWAAKRAAPEDERCQKIGNGRRMGAEETLRHRLVG